MNKKPLTKVQKAVIVIVTVLIVLAATYGILYGIWPTQVYNYTMLVWGWLNQPLPLFGLSAITIIIIIFRIFATSSFGRKKLNELKAQYNDLRYDYDSYKESADTKIKSLENRNQSLESELTNVKEFNKKLCELIPNKKVKAIGEQYYGEQTKEENN